MVDYDFETFLECIRDDNLNKVKAMLTVDLINKVDEFGRSPLHIAVIEENLQMVRLLLAFCQEKNILRSILKKRNRLNSRTALSFAKMYGPYKIAQCLREANAYLRQTSVNVNSQPVSLLRNNRNDTAPTDDIDRPNMNVAMMSGNGLLQTFVKLQAKKHRIEAEKQRLEEEKQRLEEESIRNQAQIDLLLQLFRQQQNRDFDIN